MVLLTAVTVPAVAQRVEPLGPLTLIVGRAESPAPAERVDAWRRGFAKTPLPEGTLRVTWRRSVGPSIEHSPLVTPDGDIVALTARGDIVELGSDGTEKRRLGLGVGPLGPGAILADGTIVTTTSAGEAVGIRLDAQNTRIRFRTRLGDRGMLPKVAPLALDDGGVVVASAVRKRDNVEGAPASFESEMASLDAEGRVRAEVRVPLPVVWPLLATRAGVAAIAADGTVFLWGAGYGGSAFGQPVRIGSFDGALDGGAAALDGSTLVAVVDGRRVVELDLEHGLAKVLTSTGASALLGPPSIAGGTTYILEATATGTRVVAIDGAGGVSRERLSVIPGGLEADGGPAAPILAPVHTATLVDGSGRIAFAGPDGHVGVFHAGNVVDLGEVICERGAPPLAIPPPPVSPPSSSYGRPSAGFAGLAPSGPGSFLVACEGGALLEVRGGAE
jgi:outer membrane protein assembly factor BamB